MAFSAQDQKNLIDAAEATDLGPNMFMDEQILKYLEQGVVVSPRFVMDLWITAKTRQVEIETFAMELINKNNLQDRLPDSTT